MQDTLLLDAVTLYLDYLEAAGRSPYTVRLYKHILSACLRRSLCPSQLDVRDFLDSTPSTNTRRTNLMVLRQYYRWAKERGILTEDPTVGIPAPRPHRRRWPLVTEEEFAAACGQLDSQGCLLATTLYGVGSRIGETVSMRAEHVSFDGEYGVVDFPLRKGGESGFAVFGPEVVALLKPWVVSHKGWVFPQRDPRCHISPNQATNILKRAGKRAGLVAPFVPHRLRHSYITSAVDSGWSQLALQQQIGHKDAGSTAWYYKPTRQGLLRVLRGVRRQGVDERR